MIFVQDKKETPVAAAASATAEPKKEAAAEPAKKEEAKKDEPKKEEGKKEGDAAAATDSKDKPAETPKKAAEGDKPADKPAEKAADKPAETPEKPKVRFLHCLVCFSRFRFMYASYSSFRQALRSLHPSQQARRKSLQRKLLHLPRKTTLPLRNPRSVCPILHDSL